MKKYVEHPRASPKFVVSNKMAATAMGHFDADTPLHPGTPVEDYSPCGNPVGKCSLRDMSGLATRASFVGSVISALRGVSAERGNGSSGPKVPVLANTAANWEDYLN